MALRELVLRRLIRAGASAALRHRAALDRSLQAASPSEVPELLRRRGELVATLERAMKDVAAELPPFEIAVRIEAAVARVVTELPKARGPAFVVVCEELHAIAGRIHAVWAPGVDLPALVNRLADVPARARLARPEGPCPPHDRLGWAPTGGDELLARAAAVLGTSDLDLQRRAAREAAERDEAIGRLEAAQSALGRVSRSLGLHTPERLRADALERELAREAAEASEAFEDAWYVVTHALAVFPPLRLEQAVRAAALVGPLAREDVALVFHPDGVFAPTNLGGQRALFLAALTDVRQALDDVFPGLGPIAAGGDAALLEMSRLERSGSAGPYRGRVDPEDASGSPAVQPAEADAAVVALLDAAGAPTVVRRGLAHATMLGFLGRDLEPGSRELQGALAGFVRADTSRGPATAIERMGFHRHAVRFLRDALVRGCADARLPHVLIHEAIVQTKAAVGALKPIDLMLTAAVGGRNEAMAAVDRLQRVLGDALGLPGDLWQIAALVGDLCQGRAVAPWPGVGALHRLVDALAPTPFPHLIVARSHLVEHVGAARLAAERAEAAVPMLDRVNILFSSELEKQRDALALAAASASAELDQVTFQAAALFEGAASAHPGLAVLGATQRLRTDLLAVRARPATKYQPSYLVGEAVVAQRIAQVAGLAHAVLGPLTAPAAVLERYAVARLVARRGYLEPSAG